MKHLLTAAFALSFVHGTAVLAQEGRYDRGNDRNVDRNGQDSDRDDRRMGRDGRDRERAEQERLAQEKAQAEKVAQEKAEREKAEREKAAREQADREKAQREAADRADRDRQQADRGRDRERDGNRVDNNRGGSPRWARGDRLPSRYRDQKYVVKDWRQYGLRPPPHGQYWIRNDSNDYFLAMIGTGIVVDVRLADNGPRYDSPRDNDDRDRGWRQRYGRTYSRDDDIYYNECRNQPDPAGVIVGALIGGLLGHEVAGRGDRTGATVAGVIVGGAMGAALTNKLDCEDRSYAYKSYYDGFNAGRPNASYTWNNPRNKHRGEFKVGRYYDDQGGFRCATYSQVVYIDGRPQEAQGNACRQPDGTWAIVSGG